ncbi:hypothetical protein ACLOJK_005915 [Asimina triloba]
MGYTYVNEYMFTARVGLLFEFDIVEALNVFEVVSIQLMPNLWKTLRVISWLGEWMGHQID